MLHHYPRRVTYLMLGLTALLIAYPLWGPFVLGGQSAFFIEKLTTMLIFGLFAMSLDLLVGTVGLVSLGHALFFGLAGYTLAIASPEYSPASLWWMVPLVIAVCALTGLVVGALVIRTKGIYFIMTTLAFGQMLYYLVSDATITGGTDGMFVMFKPSLAIGNWQILDLENPLVFFYFALGVIALGYCFLRWLTRSYFGQVLDGIYDNEQRMKALGYTTDGYKLVAFMISGVLAGIAGMLMAMQYGFANPGLLNWHMSGEVLMMVILGGMGTIFGPLLGAFAYLLLQYGFEHLTTHWHLLMGATIIVTVLVLPRGLAGLILDPPSFKGRLPVNRLKTGFAKSMPRTFLGISLPHKRKDG